MSWIIYVVLGVLFFVTWIVIICSGGSDAPEPNKAMCGRCGCDLNVYPLHSCLHFDDTYYKAENRRLREEVAYWKGKAYRHDYDFPPAKTPEEILEELTEDKPLKVDATLTIKKAKK